MRFCKFVRVLLKLQSLGFRSSCGRASYFSLLAQREVIKRHGTPVVRSLGSGNCSCVALPPASMPSPALRVREGAAGFAECTSVCMQRTGAHRARQPTAFPAHPRRTTRAPLARLLRARAKESPRCSPWMDGFVDKRRRPRCRASQARRDQPAGARRWIAALAKQYRDVLSEQPRLDEKRRGFCGAGCAAKHRAPRLAFCLLLGNAKSKSLGRRTSESSAWKIKTEKELD